MLLLEEMDVFGFDVLLLEFVKEFGDTFFHDSLI